MGSQSQRSSPPHVARLNAPDLGRGNCGSLRVTATTPISAEELAYLKREFPFDASGHLFFVTYRPGAPGRASLQETIFVRELRTGKEVTDGPSSQHDSQDDDIESYVYFEVLAEMDDDGDTETNDDADALGRFLDWLRERENLAVNVYASLRFPRAEFEPAVSFPVAPPPFTGVRSIGLVKRAEDEATVSEGAFDYYVTITEEKDDLVGAVRFLFAFPEGDMALTKLLSVAKEIAEFAFRKRTMEGVS
jgi:hypothetical protein